MLVAQNRNIAIYLTKTRFSFSPLNRFIIHAPCLVGGGRWVGGRRAEPSASPAVGECACVSGVCSSVGGCGVFGNMADNHNPIAQVGLDEISSIHTPKIWVPTWWLYFAQTTHVCRWFSSGCLLVNFIGCTLLGKHYQFATQCTPFRMLQLYVRPQLGRQRCFQ